MNIQLLKQLMRLKQDKLHKILCTYLNKNYDTVVIRDKFIIAMGNIPIGLVAHLDTVHPMAPREFFYDQEAKVLWSPQGLGADDRAGVYAILQIIEAGYRPHIIFCHDEETGGIGAKEIIKMFPDSPFENLKCLIELDRSGDIDCVFYDCGNDDFEQYIEKFGFKTDIGSFSDISILAPQWEVAAVNLSVGYENEHTKAEYIKLAVLEATIEKVKYILDEEPNMINYAYVPKIYYNYRDTTCLFCQRPVKKGKGLMIPTSMGSFYETCFECYNQYFEEV